MKSHYSPYKMHLRFSITITVKFKALHWPTRPHIIWPYWFLMFSFLFYPFLLHPRSLGFCFWVFSSLKFMFTKSTLYSPIYLHDYIIRSQYKCFLKKPLSYYPIKRTVISAKLYYAYIFYFKTTITMWNVCFHLYLFCFSFLLSNRI